MKITFVHPDLGIGGAERLVIDVAVALKKKGHEVNFVTNHCDKNHAFEEIKRGDFPVRVIGDWLPTNIFGKFQALCAYTRMIFLSIVYVFFLKNEDTSDVFFVDQIPVAVPFLKLTQKPVLYYCHHPDLLASSKGGDLKKLYRVPIDWTEERCTGKADVLLVNSKYTGTVFRKTFPSIEKPIKILYPTIAESFKDSISNIEANKHIYDLVRKIDKEKSIIFLSINRFHPAKNLQLVIKALDILRHNLLSETFNAIQLILAGGYDPRSAINETYFTQLVTLTNALNLQNNIIFLKSPSDELKAQLLISCDCLIYTPINEHFGIVPLEAMTAGKPVIACNSGGPCETVDHENTGFLCEPTRKSMAKYMKYMLDHQKKNLLGKNGLEKMQNEFSHDIFVENVNQTVRDCVEARN